MHATKRMAVLSIVTSLVTLALKFGAFFMTASVSLLSDALEAFVNLAAGLIAFAALSVALRPADDKHAYGHEKAEYFASGVEGALILIAAASIVFAAVQRFMEPVALVRLGPGIFIALIAAAANYGAARVMLKVAQQHDSITIEADAKHLMTDVWTSIGVVCGLLIVWFVPSWSVLDPIMAIVVALHIVHTGVDLLRRSVNGLMDVSLPQEEIRQSEQLISEQLPAYACYQALRTRKAGSRRFIEFNLLVPGDKSVLEGHQLCDRIEAAFAARWPKASVTIHVEPHELTDDSNA
jgi:cation diffusion facilitator family transporter